MHPSLSAIMDGLAAALRTISGLRVYAHVPDNLAPPAAIVQLPRSIDYDLTWGRGADVYTIPVLALVGSASDRASHANLAAYLDADGLTSIKAAIEADVTLGGVVDDARVSRADGVGAYTFAGVEYAGALLTVAIVA